jgi:hypothetical protein
MKAQHMFNTIWKAIIDCFLDTYDSELHFEDLTLNNSSDKTKYSRHIVIKSFCVKNNSEARFFTNKVIALVTNSSTIELPAVGITGVRHEAVELAGDVEAAVITMAEPFAEGLKFHKHIGFLFHYRKERPSYCVVPEVEPHQCWFNP